MFGNHSDLDLLARNACRVLHMAGDIEVPIFKGCPKPLVRTFFFLFRLGDGHSCGRSPPSAGLGGGLPRAHRHRGARTGRSGSALPARPAQHALDQVPITSPSSLLVGFILHVNVSDRGGGLRTAATGPTRRRRTSSWRRAARIPGRSPSSRWAL